MIPDVIELQVRDENFDWATVKRFNRPKQKVTEKTRRFLWIKWVEPTYEFTQTPREFYDTCVEEARRRWEAGEPVRLVEPDIYVDEYGHPWGSRVIW